MKWGSVHGYPIMMQRTNGALDLLQLGFTKFSLSISEPLGVTSH